MGPKGQGGLIMRILRKDVDVRKDVDDIGDGGDHRPLGIDVS